MYSNWPVTDLAKTPSPFPAFLEALSILSLSQWDQSFQRNVSVKLSVRGNDGVVLGSFEFWQICFESTANPRILAPLEGSNQFEPDHRLHL